MIAHRLTEVRQIRSSFQRACTRIGLSSLGRSFLSVNPRVRCVGESVPAERERKDTEGWASCQPPFGIFFEEIRQTVPAGGRLMPQRVHAAMRKLPISNHLRSRASRMAEFSADWRSHQDFFGGYGFGSPHTGADPPPNRATGSESLLVHSIDSAAGMARAP